MLQLIFLCIEMKGSTPLAIVTSSNSNIHAPNITLGSSQEKLKTKSRLFTLVKLVDKCQIFIFIIPLELIKILILLSDALGYSDITV